MKGHVLSYLSHGTVPTKTVIVFLERTAERKYSEQMWKICLG